MGNVRRLAIRACLPAALCLLFAASSMAESYPSIDREMAEEFRRAMMMCAKSDNPGKCRRNLGMAMSFASRQGEFIRRFVPEGGDGGIQPVPDTRVPGFEDGFGNIPGMNGYPFEPPRGDLGGGGR